MKKGFVLYNDYKQHFELLSNEELGILLRGTMAYEAENILPNFDGKIQMAFSFIKAQLDRDAEKYQKTVEQRKKAGKAGGLASASKRAGANASKCKQTEANQADTDTGTDTGTDTVTGTDTGTDNDTEAKVAFLDCVHLAPAQHKELLKTFGETKTAELIQILNDYKASTGRTYQSDFHAIKSWVLKKYDEERQGQNREQSAQNPAKTKFHNYEGRKWDHDTLMKLEKEYIERKLMNNE